MTFFDLLITNLVDALLMVAFLAGMAGSIWGAIYLFVRGRIVWAILTGLGGVVWIALCISIAQFYDL
jgi:hypothetical protein